MLDLGWSEMLVLVVVAIVVIGPKDLPRVMRTVGQWVGKARSMAREFQGSIDEMVRESELDELRKEANSIVSLEDNSRRVKPADPTGSADGKFESDREAPRDIAPQDPGAEARAAAPDNVEPLPRTYTPPAEEAGEPDSQTAGEKVTR